MEAAPLRRYVIVREMPGVGASTDAEMREAAENSMDKLRETGTDRCQWEHSYVADDRTFCVYLATGEDVIREHAAKAGITANAIHEVRRMLDPTDAAGAK